MSESVSADDDEEGTSQHQQLQDIFVKVTGTDVCVEKQNQTVDTGRDISGEDGDTAEYVSTMVQDDGLSETLAEPASDAHLD